MSTISLRDYAILVFIRYLGEMPAYWEKEEFEMVMRGYDGNFSVSTPLGVALLEDLAKTGIIKFRPKNDKLLFTLTEHFVALHCEGVLREVRLEQLRELAG
jgi:hypothetical protein